MDDQLNFFKENGYLVVPNVLTPDEVETINEAIDRDLAENKPMWMDRKNGRLQTVHILLASLTSTSPCAPQNYFP